MHISRHNVDVEAFDKAGIVEVCPAGDKERDVTGPQWDQRVAVMRNSMIYFRNNPSILFWETGNTPIKPDQMKQMIDLQTELDPHGMRAVGCRGNADADINTALNNIAQYYGVMIGQDKRTDELTKPTDMFRAYSIERRNRAPLTETEDFRDEVGFAASGTTTPAPLRLQKKAPRTPTTGTRKPFLPRFGVLRYNAYWSNRISNPDPAHSKWSAYASIYFSDSNADGRQDSSEVARVSGKVDAVRLPKEMYFVSRVMQNPNPDIHIIGHWTYPANTKKTIYVASNAASVELQLNGKSLGKSDHPADIAFDKNSKPLLDAPNAQPTGFIFAFPNIPFSPGTLTAIGYDTSGKKLVEDQLETAGKPAARQLTPNTTPTGHHAGRAPTSPSSTSKSSTPTHAAAPHRRIPHRLPTHRPRPLARRLQLRHHRLHQQHLPQRRKWHQPHLHQIHPHPRQNHPHRHPQRPPPHNYHPRLPLIKRAHATGPLGLAILGSP